MRIAIVGGGIFGVTIALRLHAAGETVEIFEKEPALLMGASGGNQLRLHRGYHYPRSPLTLNQAAQSVDRFESEYAPAVLSGFEHYYAIAREGSKTSPEAFRAFCLKGKLPHEQVRLPLLDESKVDLCLKVRENLLDIARLRELCEWRLAEARIRCHLSTLATPDSLKDFDLVVASTYSSNNEFCVDERDKRPARFEVCEKPLVRLPAAFAGKSVVIMDGPFMCLDPYGRTGLFLWGNVVHAIHHENVGNVAEIPDEIRPLVSKGIVAPPSFSRFGRFKDAAAEFFPAIRDAEHVGSIFSVRTVLPEVESTDCRPTLVREVNDRVITVFAGKIAGAIAAADEVERLVKRRRSSGAA